MEPFWRRLPVLRRAPPEVALSTAVEFFLAMGLIAGVAKSGGLKFSGNLDGTIFTFILDAQIANPIKWNQFLDNTPQSQSIPSTLAGVTLHPTHPFPESTTVGAV